MRILGRLFLMAVLAMFLVACGSKQLAGEKTRGPDEAKMKQLDQRVLTVQTDR
jgi:hypothetical protein